ncbi:MAG: TauD/TfdA family dioxygenase [Pseudotabrizicola sp.]|uniref:TauD/TfdA dioxygenase family protein n=1 Tax=Pseudotabrizicola sp. TaxID=2939647 RepID=UPI0027282B87|nr:TauD/TfdA family dioxygenase [Pseudotabrizicola sp.]MDO9640406.1 TauD/TfdA family dioxygenase [Pseudotabrizicola sp.]
MTIQDQLLATLPDADVLPLTPRIGAEIRNIRLSGDLPDSLVDQIKARIALHKVVFFRGQHDLDDAGQEAFARRLGALVPHPTQKIRDASEAILELDSDHGGRADQWHTDVTFVPDYPRYSVLRGVTIPAVGGDTVWANTATAFNDLPAPLQQLAESLRAVHSNAYDYAAQRPRATEVDRKHYEEVFRSTVFETEHPLVHVHPETGEKNILLGSFVQRIKGLDRFESAKLYEVFQNHVTSPENTVRWRWQEGDVAIWDNRATQHRAVNDYGDARRVVRRVTIAGTAPVGADGSTSKAIR